MALGMPKTRHLALDVARGRAVIWMIYVHLAPAEGARTPIGHVCTGLAQLLEDKAAALFCVLVGMSWAIQAQRAGKSRRWPRYVARHAVSLGVVGILLHALVWPTEILLPLAVMMVLSLAVFRAGRPALLLAILLLLIAAPVMTALFGNLVALDWTESGSHVADSAFGWATLRCLVYDDNYPIIPWLVFPLMGMLLTTRDWTSGDRARSWFLAALPLAIGAQIYVIWAGGHADLLGNGRPYLDSTWTPTSVPFIVTAGSWALVVIVGLLWRQGAVSRLRITTSLAQLGRASLTHYILHICLVYGLLRRFFPAENWPLRVGIEAFLLYIAFAIPLTALWFRRFARGPLESLWASLSGRFDG
jgi:uncharacterized membrane protein YeiB